MEENTLENEMYDLVIVGGGPAGLSAGIYAMRAAMHTVLIEKGMPGGQIALTKDVENYPGIEEVGGFELCEKFLNHAKRYNLEIRENEVTCVEPGVDFHEVVLADGTRLHTHAVILAPGGSARKLGVPGEMEQYGKGVSYCATCDGFFFRGKTVVVVGGGDTALEDALYLSKICAKVYLVHRRDEFRGSRILQQRVFAESRITLVLSSVLENIVADDQGVTGVKVKNVQTEETQYIATDGVFIFVGFLPNNGLVPSGVKMNASGYVITDEKCETSLPGVFAVGDLRQKYANQIVLAAADGCVAALAAAHYVEMRKAQADRK
ncbi:MAG: thioredoxin-disulfide reductase [Desulfomicrobium sp.]|nr:thioredoxin-disulfide reductase [Pseudomonadota bacterium]MBV1714090.1 thioredoxin-disulfide reductase [Desulfomicrobium sp.]MBU4571627.1 thioredoxin-disulfide reductase [Pseudomonadota bacterium]MBU4595775.1 thioredoxin-disulfide reductase [Pseudomonadota bacterium]MBV1721693.1 thioredoxin-disulfide reductase [Desulfomicrobium sp.]